MTTSKTLCTLCFECTDDYAQNLKTLISGLHQSAESAIVVAPEVCLTGFDYDRFEAAAAFGAEAVEMLRSCVGERVLIFTVIERRGDEYFNVVKVLHRGRIVHEQGKARLFRLGDEHAHFTPADEARIVPFQIDGVRIGVLVCFELRFKHLWQRLEGCDLIAVPSRWGRLRSNHFVTLSTALAIMNRCYVLAADATNEDATAQSGIITPFGVEQRNGNALCLEVPYDENEIRTMRRYLDVTIDA